MNVLTIKKKTVYLRNYDIYIYGVGRLGRSERFEGFLYFENVC